MSYEINLKSVISAFRYVQVYIICFEPYQSEIKPIWLVSVFHLSKLSANRNLASKIQLVLEFEKDSYSQLPGSLSPDYKYLHARQRSHDCIKYIIGVFCYSI